MAAHTSDAEDIQSVKAIGDLRLYFLMTESERLGVQLLDFEVKLSGLRRVSARDSYKARMLSDFDDLAKRSAILALVADRFNSITSEPTFPETSGAAAAGNNLQWIEDEKRRVSTEITAGTLRFSRFCKTRYKLIPAKPGRAAPEASRIP